jgi:hypothetical protein
MQPYFRPSSPESLYFLNVALSKAAFCLVDLTFCVDEGQQRQNAGAFDGGGEISLLFRG